MYEAAFRPFTRGPTFFVQKYGVLHEEIRKRRMSGGTRRRWSVQKSPTLLLFLRAFRLAKSERLIANSCFQVFKERILQCSVVRI